MGEGAFEEELMKGEGIITLHKGAADPSRGPPLIEEDNSSSGETPSMEAIKAEGEECVGCAA